VSKVKKYRLDGKSSGEVAVNAVLADAETSPQLIKDYIVAIRKNKRQWSANTRTRAEVEHTTAKPHPQKGTGRARQGNLVTPQFRGGGIVGGPKPKFDQHVKINKKERQAAIKGLIGDKIRSGSFHVIEESDMEEPKTKTIADFLKSRGIVGRVLFLGEGQYTEVATEGKKAVVSLKSKGHANFSKSIRNIPKAAFSFVKNINGYDLMVAKDVVITETALKELETWLA